MTCARVALALLALLLANTFALATGDDASRPDHGRTPGVVVSHSPAATGLYIGSPSIAVLPDGAYVASHDFFGPKSNEHQSATSAVFRSVDRGETWKPAARIDGAFWSNLFVHQGHLFLMGTTRHHGLIVIRRSDDGGQTWTTPKDADSGLLTESGEYHTAPTPVLIHDGRLWRGFEDAGGGPQWGTRYRAMMISAPVDADLLKRGSWTFSNFIDRDPRWMEGRFRAWLEGNAVVSPDGQLFDILRMHYDDLGSKAAMVRISDDGATATFDPTNGFIDFPGGAKKFTIRFDPQSKAYWSLVNPVMPVATLTRHAAGSIRNALALTRSADLRKWEIRCILLYHPDIEKHAFQYPDWQFDGDDLIAAIRTAYDDGLGGAHRAHDANYLTFHRFANFRDLTMADSVVDPRSLDLPPTTKLEAGGLVIEGRGFALQPLENEGRAFANRAYVWQGLPESLRGGRFTQTSGGVAARISVTARRASTIHVATTGTHQGMDASAWAKEPELGFHYTDSARTPMQVFSRALKAGERIELPQESWTGSLLLIPPDAAK